jgi:hypothetical protein
MKNVHEEIRELNDYFYSEGHSKALRDIAFYIDLCTDDGYKSLEANEIKVVLTMLVELDKRLKTLNSALDDLMPLDHLNKYTKHVEEVFE